MNESEKNKASDSIVKGSQFILKVPGFDVNKDSFFIEVSENGNNFEDNIYYAMGELADRSSGIFSEYSISTMAEKVYDSYKDNLTEEEIELYKKALGSDLETSLLNRFLAKVIARFNQDLL